MGVRLEDQEVLRAWELIVLPSDPGEPGAIARSTIAAADRDEDWPSHLLRMVYLHRRQQDQASNA